MSRHVNIPIFIPHDGCRNDCVFCNQRTITGVQKHDDSKVREIIENALSTIEDDAETEIAFFGGSFTGIGIERMTYLCDVAYSFVKQQRVKSIRLSTRPDYIDKNILTILKDRGVTHIELGIQSACDNVLSSCKRGHGFADTINACKLINEFGFILGGQMMIGLPCSTSDDEIYTAQQIVKLGCKQARIYPCVVFKKTELYQMAIRGEYSPLSLQEAIDRSAKVFSVFQDANINVLRIGLQSSENLSDKNEVYAGANHPALGELVISRYFLLKVQSFLENYRQTEHEFTKHTLFIDCAKGDLSKVIGQRGKNRQELLHIAKKSGFSDIKITENENIQKNQLNIHF
ncbi:MAG: radical SAM protein [Clostridia bacterium]|nr:radical SAM protein [Clostridia bacterium]